MADIVYAGQTPGGPLNKGALPSNYDLVIYKGDYVSVRLTMENSDNTPMNLTGAIPRAVLKSDYSDNYERPFECTVEDNQIHIFLPSESCSELLPGSYIWDFQITFSSGQTRTFLAGDVTVYDEVTT
jgi:hypothetical protein